MRVLTPTTASEAVEYFKTSGVLYSDIDRAALDALLAFADIELAKCRLNPDTPHKRSMRMLERVDVRGSGRCFEARLMVTCDNFDQREAFLFEPSGFINIAGWADSHNVQPFIAAFVEWVDWMADRSADVD